MNRNEDSSPHEDLSPREDSSPHERELFYVYVAEREIGQVLDKLPSWSLKSSPEDSDNIWHWALFVSPYSGEELVAAHREGRPEEKLGVIYQLVYRKDDHARSKTEWYDYPSEKKWHRDSRNRYTYIGMTDRTERERAMWGIQRYFNQAADRLVHNYGKENPTYDKVNKNCQRFVRKLAIHCDPECRPYLPPGIREALIDIGRGALTFGAMTMIGIGMASLFVLSKTRPSRY